MNSIVDTHKLPYRNAIITAVAHDTQTPISFYNVDGIELAGTLYTDASGFVFYGNGAHSANGYFVQEKATITATTGASSVQWNIDKSLDESDIGNGEVISAKTNSAAWSANSKNSWKPSWDDLWNKPTLGTWTESQCNVGINTWGQAVAVSNDCTVLRLDDAAECLSHDQCGYRKAIQLMPPKRVGQQLIIVNSTGSDTSIWNTAVTIAPTDDDQYTGAVTVLGDYEGVVLAAVRGMDSDAAAYKWLAVTDTSLMKQTGSNSFGGLQYFTFTNNVTGSVDIKGGTNVLMVSAQNSTGHALRLVFNKAGQTVAVVNDTADTLYLSNSMPTGLADAATVATVPGWSSSDPIMQKNTCMIASGILNGNILFWSDSTHSITGSTFTELIIPVNGTNPIKSVYNVPADIKVLCISTANDPHQLGTLSIQLVFSKPGQTVTVINNTRRLVKLYNVYPNTDDGAETTVINSINSCVVASGMLANTSVIRFWVSNPSKVQNVLLPDQTVEYNASATTVINDIAVQTFVRNDAGLIITFIDPEVYNLNLADNIDTLQIIAPKLTVSSLPTPTSGSWTIVHRKTVRVLNSSNVSGQSVFVRKIHASNFDIRFVQTLADPETAAQHDYDNIVGFYPPEYCTLVLNGDTWSTPTGWAHPVTEWQAK